jgi:hypothetical protein
MNGDVFAKNGIRSGQLLGKVRHMSPTRVRLGRIIYARFAAIVSSHAGYAVGFTRNELSGDVETNRHE